MEFSRVRHAITRLVPIVPVALLAALLAASAAWAQEADQEVDQEVNNTGTDAPVDEAPARDADGQSVGQSIERSVDEDPVELDERNYADAEEEDFVPSEDIPTDQAIAFPTDI